MTLPLSRRRCLSTLWLATATACGALPARAARPAVPAIGLPDGFKLVFEDDFETLLLRTGGPKPDGYAHGTGTWTPSGEQGFGYEWFVNSDKDPFSPFSVANSILTIEAGPMPSQWAPLFPAETRGKPTHFGGSISTYDSFFRSPPFYAEARMKLSAHSAAWPAFWTLGRNRKPWPPALANLRQWEIDVIETYGDIRTYLATIHWNDEEGSPAGPAPYRFRAFPVPVGAIDLASTFNVFGVLATAKETAWYFNGTRVARAVNPTGADSTQPQFLILDLAFGHPWDSKERYSETTISIQIDYVRAYAPS